MDRTQSYTSVWRQFTLSWVTLSLAVLMAMFPAQRCEAQTLYGTIMGSITD